MTLKGYPSDVSEEEWAFVAPYLTLMTEDAPQREHSLRQVFNALRWMVRSGSPWRYLPHDFPRWEAVYQQTQRWLKAGCFEAMVHDLRLALRVLQEREPTPTAAIYDSRVLSSTPESGQRAGYNGHKKRKGSKVHIAVDTLGHLLALKVTAANKDDCTQVEALSQELQEATGENVEIAYVDQVWIRVIAVKRQQNKPVSMALNWWWSNSKKLNVGLCCCPSVGWWSAALPGPRAFGAWLKIMNDCRRQSLGCTSWLLPVSCSNGASHSLQMHNTL